MDISKVMRITEQLSHGIPDFVKSACVQKIKSNQVLSSSGALPLEFLVSRSLLGGGGGAPPGPGGPEGPGSHDHLQRLKSTTGRVEEDHLCHTSTENERKNKNKNSHTCTAITHISNKRCGFQTVCGHYVSMACHVSCCWLSFFFLCESKSGPIAV